jgi:hypothetical protein
MEIPVPSESELLMWIDTIRSIYQQELGRDAASFELAHYLWCIMELGYTGDDIRREVKALVPPAPPAPVYQRASLAELIKANFCGSRLANGEVIFDIFLGAWERAKRNETYQLKRKAGLNTIVLAVQGGYDGAYPFDFYNNLSGLRNLILEVQKQGFNVILFLCSGEKGAPEIERFDQVLTYLKTVGVKDLRIVPAWEPVKGNWTSAELSKALKVIYPLLDPSWEMWVHLWDDRASGASNPPEVDDPWKSYEPGFWMEEGGDKLHGLLYQSVSGDKLLNADSYPEEYLGYKGYRNRLVECMMRVRDGYKGWRQVRFCAFETVAYDYYHGLCSDADVVRIAQECKDLGVTEFGNGLPD